MRRYLHCRHDTERGNACGETSDEMVLLQAPAPRGVSTGSRASSGSQPVSQDLEWEKAARSDLGTTPRTVIDLEVGEVADHHYR
ncbi:MAG: hypothetical protein WAM97_03080 [Acidimicrobiales bacterium]